MASGDVARTIRAPGRLVINPTQAFDGGTFPYGGTEIGNVNQMMLLPLGTGFRVEYEALGEAGDVLEAGNEYIVSCFLHGWDDDAVALALTAGAEVGAVSGHGVYYEPGSATPGASAYEARKRVVAYIPDDPIHVPGILLYAAIPDWDASAELAFQRNAVLGIPLAFDCLRDAAGDILRVGRIVDLALP